MRASDGTSGRHEGEGTTVMTGIGGTGGTGGTGFEGEYVVLWAGVSRDPEDDTGWGRSLRPAQRGTA